MTTTKVSNLSLLGFFSLAKFLRIILATTYSKLLILGEVALKAAVLHSNDDETNDGDNGENTNDAANDGPDNTALLFLLKTFVVE